MIEKFNDDVGFLEKISKFKNCDATTIVDENDDDDYLIDRK